jgi:hypothetical protein
VKKEKGKGASWTGGGASWAARADYARERGREAGGLEAPRAEEKEKDKEKEKRAEGRRAGWAEREEGRGVWVFSF